MIQLCYQNNACWEQCHFCCMKMNKVGWWCITVDILRLAQLINIFPMYYGHALVKLTSKKIRSSNITDESNV